MNPWSQASLAEALKRQNTIMSTDLSIIYNTPNMYIVAHHHEISGSNARLTLVRLRCYIETGTNYNYDDMSMTRLSRLINCLSHIQDLAYATEIRRTPANILAMYNLTFLFATDYVKVYH